MIDPQPYDHYRPTGDYPDGVYRVVGTGDPVVLVAVTDAEDTRVNSGRLVRVPVDDLAGFEPAENPDAGFRPGQVLDGAVEEGRMLLDWLRSLLGG
ncbi:MAG: hypothetical protein ABEH56_01010 [Salinirussus sp.]